MTFIFQWLIKVRKLNLFNYYIHTLIKWSHLQSKLFLHTKYKKHYIISIKQKKKQKPP